MRSRRVLAARMEESWAALTERETLGLDMRIVIESTIVVIKSPARNLIRSLDSNL